MDEPFTGLDPVNLVLLREAFMELRDRGRTLIFSTHQMEAAEAMCESVAIVDHGRLVAGGRVRDLKRASGRRSLRLAVDGDVSADVAGRAARGRRAVRARGRWQRARAVARRGSGRRPRRRPRPGRRRSRGSRSSSRASRRCSSSTSGGPPTTTSQPGTRGRDAVAARPGAWPDGRPRPAPPECRDRRPARVPRPRPRPAVPGLDDRAHGPRHAGRAWRRSPSATSIARP